MTLLCLLRSGKLQLAGYFRCPVELQQRALCLFWLAQSTAATPPAPTRAAAAAVLPLRRRAEKAAMMTANEVGYTTLETLTS